MDRITLSAREAAEFLGISYWMILELVKQKRLPCVKVGNRKLFRKETLTLWLDNMERESKT
jgi:excisionase family DNA binding protein